ncbi:hypothetical protein SKAU_G00232450 [Synaphobranchus kaupii]|uniref:Uncharacterized protein n=1 Tax=Synaphobranchus kaupii TaxID=118154 RepID=A0A9Q1F5Y7_SYNKA|nr:hypothetical protein SKAU_G00232450 [Synaphobranchus kaupii]
MTEEPAMTNLDLGGTQLRCKMNPGSPGEGAREPSQPRREAEPAGDHRRGDASSGFPRRRGTPSQHSWSRPPGNSLSTQTE